jgi:hypothetical protein
LFLAAEWLEQKSSFKSWDGCNDPTPWFHSRGASTVTGILKGEKPIILAVEGTGTAGALSDFSQSLVGYEKVARLAMGEFMDEVSRATPISGPDETPYDERASIQAALPHKTPAVPRQKRKLLVIDLSTLFITTPPRMPMRQSH